MRRIIITLLCILLLVTSVSAAGISDCRSESVFADDGSCEVTLTLTLVLDGPVSDLVFPLSADARNITVNGANARSTAADSVRNVDLSKHVSGAGTYTLVLRYQLPDAVTADARGNLSLSLELLSGFAYPIEQFSFTILLPGEQTHKPTFTSTYHQEAAEIVMDIAVEGNAIRGSFTTRLQDHETLIMTLAVDETLFPQSVAKKWSLDTLDVIMIGLALLAIAYFLLTMGLQLPQKLRRTTAPEGITAGELGCWLMGQGVDLTTMVLSWAQMGYILIQPDDNGRVLLHKRMDMGNERSEFEVRYFRNLFGRRTTVDATGYHYARLCGKASSAVPRAQSIYKRHTGNPNVFRVLTVAIGTMAGVSLATAFVRDTGWQIVLGIFLGIFSTAASWIIQIGAKKLHHRDKTWLWIALGAAGFWFMLSLPAGQWDVPLFVIPAQFLAGLAAVYGGRRTEMGRQNYAELLALRRYLRTVPTDELRRIMDINPDYYYALMPHALALGVDRAFSRQMGNQRLPECTWLTTGLDGHQTAREWNQLLRNTTASMDALCKRMPIDKLLGK